MDVRILEKVTTAGKNGIKKADLKKIFGKECDDILQRLVQQEKIFIEKKGVAYFVWTKDNYVLHLTENDPKCKLIFNISKNKSSSTKVQKVPNTENTIKITQNTTNQFDDFKIEFDKCLSESSTSIGWAPFSLIRKRICESKKLSTENFYSLVSDIVENNREKYELSSGGQEGILMRGMVHGFVRNI